MQVLKNEGDTEVGRELRVGARAAPRRLREGFQRKHVADQSAEEPGWLRHVDTLLGIALAALIVCVGAIVLFT